MPESRSEREEEHASGRAWIALAALVLTLSGCGDAADRRTAGAAVDWDELAATEETIHALRPLTSGLARSLRNLGLPTPGARDLFAPAVIVRDVDAAGATSAGDAALRAGVTHTHAPASDAVELSPPDLDLWRPFLDAVREVEWAQAQVVRGAFAGPDGSRFEARLKLSAGGRGIASEQVWLQAEVDAAFSRSGDEAPWQVVRFETRRFEVTRSSRTLFREVLAEVLPSASSVRAARRSVHAELAREKILLPDGFEAPHRHFFVGSQDRHPGVAVADVDGNGHDDIYALARFGPARLYLATGDGRFVERAAALGLDVRDHNAAAVFADFDNDGDADVFLGRTLAPSRYLENDGGRFRDRTREALGEASPRLVSSAAAVDLDGDGLLDLYVSTYAAQMVVAERIAADRQRRTTGARPAPALLSGHLPADDAERLFALAGTEGAHEFLSLPGPPNVVLRNVGEGHFEPLRGDDPLRAFRNTYQATFADYDDDGDADLYLAHDFAPNQLLRNAGDGRFTDVTEATGTADIGFGMGVSWGDHDRDGRLDLYVSNMFSKAGKRITAAVDGLDPRFAKMARGNTLFRGAEPFERISGTGPGQAPVEATGWSWGGQFGDVDNDGRLDLHVLNGYYTAPLEAHVDVDI